MLPRSLKTKLPPRLNLLAHEAIRRLLLIASLGLSTTRESRLVSLPKLSSGLSCLNCLAQVRLAIDWTIEGDHHLLIVSLVTGARALPIYWRAYSAKVLKGRMQRYEMAVIKRVLSRMEKAIGSGRLIVTADRGFADVDLARLLQSFGVHFIIRVKNSTKVFVEGEWKNLSRIGFQGKAGGRTLGRVYYCESNTESLYVSMTRARNKKGKW
jgi:hypothetical protein